LSLPKTTSVIGERRQYERRAEVPRQPGQDTGTAGRRRRDVRALGLDPLSPEVAVRLFDRGDSAELLGQLRIGLAFRQRCIECRAVELALEIGTVARQVVGFGNGRQASVNWRSAPA
jgi:hypothetical protein